MPDVNNTQLVFQELFSTYREYFNLFISATVIYFTIVGAAVYYGLLKGVSKRDSDRWERKASLIIVAAFVLVVTVAYGMALYYGLSETRTLEGNLRNILDSLSKVSLKAQMPYLLSSSVNIMIYVSIVMLGFIIIASVFFFIHFRKNNNSSNNT